MKKIFSTVFVVAVLIISFLYMITSRCEATRENYNDVADCIVYNQNCYIEWSQVEDVYCYSGVISDDEMYPYYLLTENLREKVYISGKSIYDLIPPYSYFSFCVEGNDFIFESPDDTSLNILYVKEGFIFPVVQKDKIEGIYMSLSYDDESNIKDEETVKLIVDCAQNLTEKELDRSVYDYIVEKSWDNCHFYLKYKGYPLVEEFFVTTTKDGRCVVDSIRNQSADGSVCSNEN